MNRAVCAVIGIVSSLAVSVTCMAAPLSIPTTPYVENIVQTDHQKYSYKEMLNDAAMLQARYPGYVKCEVVGRSVQGRDLIKITLGNPDAPKKVMVQASMHAREYMSSQLVMEMTEYICENMTSLSSNGISYRELFDNTCFVIMPMVNPDGVMLSQKGTGSLRLLSPVAWHDIQKESDIEQIKSNANGVDLNRNLPYGFGHGRDAAKEAGLEFWSGDSPLSEPETMALVECASSENYSCYVNYHTSGEVMYYSSVLTKEDASEKSALLVDVLYDRNGYLPMLDVGWEEGPTGCFSDYVTFKFQKPTVTIEIGTKNPVPAGEFKEIFEKNKDTWGDIAYLTYSNQI